jgi:hypothetical protein
VTLAISDVVDYWASQRRTSEGAWVHPADEEELSSTRHSFKLEFPVSPYIGKVLTAPVVILGANAGYSSELTAEEFPDQRAVDSYLARVRSPEASNWADVSRYYHRVNYGPLIAAGKAVLVNACAYRSPRISNEPHNRKLVTSLASARFTRAWLLEAVLGLVRIGARLVVAKRPGLWKLPADVLESKGVVVDPAPVSPNVTGIAWRAISEFLQ